MIYEIKNNKKLKRGPARAVIEYAMDEPFPVIDTKAGTKKIKPNPVNFAINEKIAIPKVKLSL